MQNCLCCADRLLHCVRNRRQFWFCFGSAAPAGKNSLVITMLKSLAGRFLTCDGEPT